MNTFIDRVNSIVQQNQQPTMSAPTEPAYPDAGIGALENVSTGAPRQTMIANQPHMLAYINPQEENLLQDYRNDAPVYIGPDGIPAYAFNLFNPSTWTRDDVAETASNIASSFTETASNAYDAVSTAATNVFGDQGYIETAADKIYDFDGDSTPDTTVYGTGPSEVITSGPITYTDSNGREHSTQAAADAENAVIAARANPLTTTSTKTKEQLIAEARAAGQTVYAWNGNWEPVPDEVVDPVETTNSVVSQDLGQAYDASGNRIDTAGALPSTSNSVRETIANLITPFDSAYYEDGTLYGYDKDGNVIDLTGGGESYNSLTGTSNYVYGVSDDAETGTAVDTTGMSEDEATVAEIKDDLLRDIPPSNLAYFGSFFGNNVIPIFGGYLAGKMLDAGIDDRRAIVDEQISALETGATPLFNDAGEYIGFDTSTMIGNVSAILDEYGDDPNTTGLLPGDLPEDVATAENERFNTVFDVQSTAAEADPTGMSTEDGFITTGSGYGALDGTEYYIEGDGSVQEVTDGVVNYDNAKSGETVESVYGLEGGDSAQTFSDGDPVIKSIYNRFRISGSTAGLPFYMSKWMDGVDFDERLEKVMVDGKVMYKNAEGDVISAEDLKNALKYDDDGNIIETEE